MFRNIYKQACDDIKPREGLLNDILKEAKHTKQKVKPNFKRITAYAASVTAVFVIAVAVVAYPNMLKNRNEQQGAGVSDSAAKVVADNGEYALLTENQETAEANIETQEQYAGKFNMPSDSSNSKEGAGSRARIVLPDEANAVSDIPNETPLLIISDSKKNADNKITEAEAVELAKGAVDIMYETINYTYDDSNDMWCVQFISENKTVCSVYITGSGVIDRVEK